MPGTVSFKFDDSSLKKIESRSGKKTGSAILQFCKYVPILTDVA